ncbi:MAG: molybdenum transporter, periplasmic molybdate-binding protein [Frankiales bacterium]|nr:molybdenum transporter, periplasmic molybdate-binding protein [Frankiales bacterium]
MRRSAVYLLALGSAVVLATTACSSSKSDTPAAGSASTPSTTTSSTTSALTGTITVLAASSLTGTFTTLGKHFEAANPGTTVKLSFGASSALAQQINQGAPVDVFASAATKNMDQVTTTGGATKSTNFVKNVMEIAVPPSNPGHIATVADLGKSGVKLVLCQPQVPCGSTAATVFKNAKVTVKPVSLEADVKSTLTKVESGDADAGVVYVTDVLAAGRKVKGIEIPADQNASTEYPIAALTKAPNAAGAQAFVDYVLSATGQSVLTAGGFLAP